MPVVHFPIDESNSILLPSFYKIINDIADSLDIQISSKIILNNNITVTSTDNSTNVTANEKDNLPTTISKRKLIINITDDYNEDSLGTTATYQFENSFIFKDHDINVYLYLIYVKTDFEFEFSYVVPSLNEANKLRDQIRIYLSRTRNILHHEIDYDIIIPEQIEEFLGAVYDNKKRFFNLSLEEYIRTHFTKRLHLITDMSNKENARLSIKEKQIRILGTFDFINPDKIEKDNDTNTYKLTFTYKFSFDVPKAIVVKYPVMICNRTLPSKYIKFIEDNKRNSLEEYKKNLSYSYSLGSLSIFESHRILENRLDIKLPINVPMFDDYKERSIHKGYGILFTFLVEIDETDKKTLLNLENLGDYVFDNKVLDYIKNVESRYITQPYQSFLYLGLQQDDLYYDLNILEVTNDLTVKSKVELSLLKPTRVLLSICLDFNMLNKNAIKRLLEYSESNNDYSVFFALIEEHLRAITNFIDIYFLTVDSRSYFIRNYILIIYELYKQDKKDILERLMQSFTINELIYNEIIIVLRDNYNEIYSYLVNNNIMPVVTNLVDRSDYIDNENTGMRTVQTSFIIALRRNN